MKAQRLAIPIYITQTDSPKLLQQFTQLAKQKSEEIEQKIDKNVQKQKHIIRIQQQIQQKLRRKNQQILIKINKSLEAKKKSLLKIQQKYHNKSKYVFEKAQAHRKKQKASLHQSWRQSLKLSEWINQRSSSKQIRNSSITQNRYTLQQKDKPNNLYSNKNNLPQIYNSTKAYKSIEVNTNTQNTKNNNRANDKDQKIMRNQRIKTQMPSNSQQKDLQFKLSLYLQKVKQKQHKQQEQQIQKYNSKLLKLQQARLKKQKIQKDKQKKIHDFIQFKQQKTQQAKKSQRHVKTQLNKKQNLNSSDVSYGGLSPKNQMFKKWSQNNKNRQTYLFQIRMRKGEDYINYMKNKSNRNKLTKQLEYNSIEKKLYVERNRLYQLNKPSLKNIQ